MPRFGMGPRKVGSKTWYVRQARKHINVNRSGRNTYSSEVSPGANDAALFVFILGLILALIPVVGGACFLVSLLVVAIILNADNRKQDSEKTGEVYESQELLDSRTAQAHSSDSQNSHASQTTNATVSSGPLNSITSEPNKAFCSTVACPHFSPGAFVIYCTYCCKPLVVSCPHFKKESGKKYCSDCHLNL